MNEPDSDLVLRIAALARLEIGRDEARALGADFARILERFRSLSELELEAEHDDVLPHAAARDVLRDDVPGEPFPSEELLRAAPCRVGDFYAVPKTIDAPAPRSGR